VARRLITPPSQITHTPSRRGEHRTDAQSGAVPLLRQLNRTPGTLVLILSTSGPSRPRTTRTTN
jgi:hypothetical protein